MLTGIINGFGGCDTKRKRKGILRTKGKHKCTEKNCDFASDYRVNVQNHIENEHSGILKFKCYICDYKSYYKHLVARHQKTTSHKNKILRIGCTLCDEDVFHTAHSNNRRRQTMGKESKGHLKCLAPACTFATDVKKNLCAHFHLAHTDTDKLVYSCNLCSYKSSTGKCIKKHQNVIHRGKKAKVIANGCEDCEKNIEHKRHKLTARPFDYGICLLCKDGVEHSEHEITTVHSNGTQGWKGIGDINKDRNIGECSICGIRLLHNKFHVQHYQKEHPNDRIFNCKDCKYATNYLPNLNTHASSKHEKKVRQCSHCSYNTTWNTSFLEHMRSAHGLFQKKTKHSVESETQPILCDDCGFSTFNQKQFNAHKLANCQSQALLQYDAVNMSKSHMRYNPSTKL